MPKKDRPPTDPATVVRFEKALSGPGDPEMARKRQAGFQRAGSEKPATPERVPNGDWVPPPPDGPMT